MKIMYTRPEDRGVSIVTAASKEDIEKVLGPLTQKQYRDHIMERSIPVDAINVKLISDESIPNSREFRNAWVDVTEDNNVNIDLGKAKDLKLAELRTARNLLLDESDKQFLMALEKGEPMDGIKARKKMLRDITDDLKNLEVQGVDDVEVLDMIRHLSTISGV